MPAGSVAVIVTRSPGAIEPGSVTSYGPSPKASVVTCAEPRYVRPSRKSFGKRTHASFAKKSTSKVVEGVECRKPWTRVPPEGASPRG